LKGARFYVAGSQSNAGIAARHLAKSHPSWARILGVMARQPAAQRIFFWNTPDPATAALHYLEAANIRQPGTTAQMTTYSLVHGHCTGHWSDSPAMINRYERWIDRLAYGIGNFHVAMFLELDSLLTVGCLSHHGVDVRLAALHYAIDRLEQQPHVVVYVDAGAASITPVPWQTTVRLLRQAGVRDGNGFFVNSTHFDWTTQEIFNGQREARALGGVHFVVATSVSGRGPLVVPPGSHVKTLCDPAGRGSGPISTDTGYKYVDGFLWFNNPGGSPGPCPGVPGAPPVREFWPAYAVGLITRGVFNKVTGPYYPLLRTGPTQFYDIH
jgi:cellulase/cellobiase CelA1